jgi:hypothetical protein
MLSLCNTYQKSLTIVENDVVSDTEEKKANI